MKVRVRDLWPLHASQPVHSAQSLYEQSTSLVTHACSLHGCVQFMYFSGHSSPPSLGQTKIVRVRDCCPPPHPTGQAVYGVQSDCLQSTGAKPIGHCGSKVPPWAGLHGSFCFRGPVQKVPPPLPSVLIVRDRDLCPRQVAEHAVHSVQTLNSQFTGGVSQGVFVQHPVTSCVVPLTGLPQAFARTLMLRDRVLTPPMHVVLQALH